MPHDAQPCTPNGSTHNRHIPTHTNKGTSLQDCFGCTVYDGYGTTETGGISNDNVINPTVQCRLEDCPDLGYTAADAPNPRGQIVVKTRTMMDGYFKDEQATRRSFTDDGWFRTGDVGERFPGGEVRIIDRLKNVFKLAQGEFIAAEQLETDFQEAPLVDSMYVHCDTSRSFLMCVVVPNRTLLRRWHRGETAGKGGGSTDTEGQGRDGGGVDGHAKDEEEEEGEEEEEDVASWAELCLSESARQHVLLQLREVGAKRELRPFQIPAVVLLHEGTFTPDNGLLTMSHKLNRTTLHKHFKERLDRLARPSASTTSKLQAILDLVLDGGGGGGGLLEDLGADSIKLVKFQKHIREQLHTVVPLSTLFGADADLDLVAGYVERAAEVAGAADAAAMYGGGSGQGDQREVALADLALPLRLGDAHGDALGDGGEGEAGSLGDVRRTRGGRAPSLRSFRKAFVTGCTGFIGSHIVVELVEQLLAMPGNDDGKRGDGDGDGGGDGGGDGDGGGGGDRKGGMLYCHVRCRNTRAAGAARSAGNVGGQNEDDSTRSSKIAKDRDTSEAEEAEAAEAAVAAEEADRQSCWARLWTALLRTGRFSPEQEASIAQRITVIVGDLAEERLGMTERQWDILCGTSGMEIVHVGSVVNWVLPYTALRAANVGGTQEVIRMATTGCVKHLTYISTISTSPGSENEIMHQETAFRGSPYVHYCKVFSYSSIRL